MTQRERNGLTILDETVEYSDSGEAMVLEVIEKAVDRSSTSDELASAATDWATMYHLSPRRANIVAPLHLAANLEILEVGAGTGAITRRLGESGARVVALEGTLPRAKAAAARCAELENVEVVCGSLDSYITERRFDLVVVVGVLEYAGTTAGGCSTPDAFLVAAKSLLKPDGAVYLAIENRIGLKYLLGYAEDHLGIPWSGVEGYPESSGIRTWSRRELADLLMRAGLTHHRWLYPYPDYKMPRAMLTDEAFAAPDGCDLVDALVRNPIEDLAFPRIRFCDERLAHRGFLEAGLGQEVANSFAVVAATDAEPVDRLGPARELIAWHFGSGRLSRWVRHRRVMDSSGVRTVQSEGAHGATRPNRVAWLEQRPASECPWTAGSTMEQRALDALDNAPDGGLEVILSRWSSYLESQSTLRQVTASEAHPFLPEGRRRVLPPHLLDCTLSNFIDRGADLVFVDDEWHAVGGVDLDLARVRGLWYLAQEMIQMGRVKPDADDLPLADLVLQLACDIGIDLEPGVVDSFIFSEAELQSIVAGRLPADLRSLLKDLSKLTMNDASMACVVPLARVLIPRGTNPPVREGEVSRSRETSSHVQGQIALAARAHAQRIRIEHLEHEIQKHVAEQERVGTWAKELEAAVIAGSAHAEHLERDLADARDRLGEAQGRLASSQAEAATQRDQHDRSQAELLSRLDSAEQHRDEAVDQLEAYRRWYVQFSSRPMVRLWATLGRLVGRQVRSPEGH